MFVWPRSLPTHACVYHTQTHTFVSELDALKDALLSKLDNQPVASTSRGETWLQFVLKNVKMRGSLLHSNAPVLWNKLQVCAFYSRWKVSGFMYIAIVQAKDLYLWQSLYLQNLCISQSAPTEPVPVVTSYPTRLFIIARCLTARVGFSQQDIHRLITLRCPS